MVLTVMTLMPPEPEPELTASRAGLLTRRPLVAPRRRHRLHQAVDRLDRPGPGSVHGGPPLTLRRPKLSKPRPLTSRRMRSVGTATRQRWTRRDRSRTHRRRWTWVPH